MDEIALNKKLFIGPDGAPEDPQDFESSFFRQIVLYFKHLFEEDEEGSILGGFVVLEADLDGSWNDNIKCY
jgi:hypothetical protein